MAEVGIKGTPRVPAGLDRSNTKADIDNKSKRDIAFYESARAEMISRITLRDQSLIAYIATAGAYFGFIVERRSDKIGTTSDILLECAIVLVLPILSLVFTYVILQHHIMIGKLGEYTRSIFPAGNPHWDHTYASWNDKRYLSARTIAQALLLIMPVAYTALFVFRVFPALKSDIDRLIVSSVLLFDGGALLMIVRLQVWAFQLRRTTDYVAN